MSFLDPNDPRQARAYLLADAKACRKVAADLRAKRCWHAIGTPGRRALEHNIEVNEMLADRIERQFPMAFAESQADAHATKED